MLRAQLFFVISSFSMFAYGTPCTDDPMKVKDQLMQMNIEEQAKNSTFYLDKARLLEEDQDHLGALQNFFRALDSADLLPQEFPLDKEERLKAIDGLSLYVDHIDSNPALVISKFRSEFEPLLTKHPEWHYMRFFQAIADANDHEFASFYKRFYQAYTNYSESFLALRTRGVLHLKLYEQLLGEERETQRKLAIKFLTKAAKKDIRESSLIRLLLFTSNKDERKAFLGWVIPAILDENVRLPRKDITLYVRWLLQDDYLDLARDFIANAKTWYTYSRSLKIAENLIEQARKQTR